ncbi:GNAT family N-acetyltransferase [Microbulbifer sp. PSTR4-B]|uniref:GNAT family N-acetyltransferase n=1 Tax=Microbulbifer sp. PSTR4-B TaxID=3243396 RepID=UPI00403A6FCD
MGFLVENGIAEVGYLLLPEFHGKKYSTESLTALMEWATLEHGITHYRAVVTKNHFTSERVLEKCSFHLEMTAPRAPIIYRKTCTDHIYFPWIEPIT